MAKTQVVDFLGERALVLPTLLAGALVANERAKYVLTLLQMAAAQAENPQPAPPSLRADREACGVAEPRFDRSIAQAQHDGGGVYHIPSARRLIELLDEALRTMLAPLKLARDDAEAAALHTRLEQRLEKLIAARPAVAEDLLTGETIAALTSGRPKAGDGFHVLVMDLHREINRLQSAIATMEVAGAKAYGLADGDIAAVTAFMTGLQRTAPLKFDHPGLGTVAARTNDALLIQNDMGTTEAHVLVVKVAGLRVTVTYTDVHLPRARFLQALCEGTGMSWQDVRARQGSGIGDADLFYVVSGELTAADTAALRAFLERLGSRLVFLIDWNKARKRLGLLVKNEAAVDLLKWAAAEDLGHRGFLQLGGERLVYDALEQAVKAPLRYGEPLHQMLGAEEAREYLRFVLQTTATGLLQGQSESLIRDRVRAELFANFRTAEQRLMGDLSCHADIIAKLATGLRTAFRQTGDERGAALARHAERAKQWESCADDVVKELRSTVRRIAGTEIFRSICETADDAADHLEDAAFVTGLLFENAPPAAIPEPLLALADLLVEGCQAFRRTTDSAQFVHRGGDRDAVQRFLEAADRVVSVEHQTDERYRALTTCLMRSELNYRQFQALGEIAHHLEAAADALMLASYRLRDHVLGDVMFA